MYDDVAKRLFGCDAGEYRQIFESEASAERITDRALWRPLRLRLRSQNEMWQDGQRVKVSVDDAHDAAGTWVRREAKRMLAEVYAALVVPRI